jgi:hypothetical protein
VREGAIGQELTLLDSLDTWAPEARGSSARVFSGRLRAEGNQARTAAVKVMRAGRHEYAVPLFREEVQVLTLMRDVPGMTPMLECGFLQPDGDLPPDDRAATSAELMDLKGSVLRFAPSEVPSFLAALPSRVDSGWLPYLVMEKRSREDNLMMFCDLGITGGRFLPLRESLQMAIQICEIMQAAHARNIVYRDHKILHYYWLEAYNGVFVIDWNVAKMHPQGLSQAEKQFDVVQFGARAMHHLLTGRPAPGALPLGPNRPEEIEAASQSYRVQWTYDDQRLPSVIRDLLERVLAGEHSSFRDLREALLQVYQQLPDAPL